jgi:hypothetical protein
LIHAKIYLMKAQLPHPQHYSYIMHRKQVARQIILPVLLAAFLIISMIVVISISTFKQGGDVGRWAAISTIWIILPLMLAGMVFLAVLGGLIYLLTLALSNLPHYTGIAQDYVSIARGYILRGADLVVKPVIALNGFLENLRAFFGRE